MDLKNDARIKAKILDIILNVEKFNTEIEVLKEYFNEKVFAVDAKLTTYLDNNLSEEEKKEIGLE